MNPQKILLFSFLFCTFFAQSQELRINEVMSNNLTTLLDDDQSESDWIELYNPSANAIYLGDYYLSDDASFPMKWQAPSISLGAHQFILIYASDKDKITDTTFHTNFKLSKSGGPLLLVKWENQLIESVQLPMLYADVSYGKSVDGNSNWVYFEQASPKASNNQSISFACQLAAPSVQVESGKYNAAFYTNLFHSDPGATLYYSLDGSNPLTDGNQYLTSVYIQQSDFPNQLSLIPTNPGFNYPLGDYNDERAQTRGWLAPYSDQENIAILKVQAFKIGCISSPVVSKTYLIDNPDNLPIVSMVIDSMDFFSDETGIYVYGNAIGGNYKQEGIDWERQASLTYFNKNKELVFSDQVGVKISGHGSRHSTVKNLQIDFRNQYGKGSVDTVLFSRSFLQRYESLSLRSGGHRPDCLPRDDYASDLFSAIDVDHAEYEFVSVYLNGEYWGIHAFKERMNEDYLAEKYNLNRQEIIVLENAEDLNFGDQSDTTTYSDLLNFVQTNDLNVPANYQHVDSLIDVQNYTDYLCSQIFIGNADWPNSNVKYWRKRVPVNTTAAFGHDGKWRWLIYDLDGAFGGSCNDVFVTFNTLEWAHLTTTYFEEYTKLIIGLMNRQAFRENYINRMCDLLNSSFMPEVTRPKLASVFNRLDPEITRHVDRWRYPSTATTLADRVNETPNLNKWQYLEMKLDSFLIERPHYTRLHMDNLWGLGDSTQVILDVNDPVMGKVKINTIEITSALEGVQPGIYPWNGSYYTGIPIPLTALANPGYRFKEWLETGLTTPELVLNLNSDSTFTAVFEIDPNYIPESPIRINEAMTANRSCCQDEFQDFDDWIELYNPNDHEVNLKGYYLTDSKNNLNKYHISNDLLIQPHGFVQFWCDDESGEGLRHTNFKLSNNGEFIGLVNPTGAFEDSITCINLGENESYGRSVDGGPIWVLFPSSTPGYSNSFALLDEQKISNFYLFPNPNNGKMLHFSKLFSGSVYTIEGQEVLHFNNANSISLEGLQNGVYFITDHQGLTKRFVVQGE